MKRAFFYFLVTLTVLLAASAFVWPRALYAFVVLCPILLLTA